MIHPIGERGNDLVIVGGFGIFRKNFAGPVRVYHSYIIFTLFLHHHHHGFITEVVA
jgi:hypothetical protein